MDFRRLPPSSTYQTRRHDSPPRSSDIRMSYGNNGNNFLRSSTDGNWGARRPPSPPRRPLSPPRSQYDRHYAPSNSAPPRDPIDHSRAPLASTSRERSPYSGFPRTRGISPPPRADRDRSSRGVDYRRFEDDPLRYGPPRMPASNPPYYQSAPPPPPLPLPPLRREHSPPPAAWNDRRRRIDDLTPTGSYGGPDMKRPRLDDYDSPRINWNSAPLPRREIGHRPYDDKHSPLLPRGSMDSVTTMASGLSSNDTYRSSPRFISREGEARFRSSPPPLDPNRENNYRPTYANYPDSFQRDERGRARDIRPGRYDAFDDIPIRDRSLRRPSPPPLPARERDGNYGSSDSIYRDERRFDSRFDPPSSLHGTSGGGPPPLPPYPPPRGNYSSVAPYPPESGPRSPMDSSHLRGRHDPPSRPDPPTAPRTWSPPRERERYGSNMSTIRSEAALRDRGLDRSLDRNGLDRLLTQDPPRGPSNSTGEPPAKIKPITVFISNLPHHFPHQKLRDFFAPVGRENIVGLDTGRAGFAFLRVATMAAAEVTVKECHHKRFENFIVNVSVGKPPSEYKKIKYDPKIKRKTKPKGLKDPVKPDQNAKHRTSDDDDETERRSSSLGSAVAGDGDDKEHKEVLGSLLGRIGDREDAVRVSNLEDDDEESLPGSRQDPGTTKSGSYSPSREASGHRESHSYDKTDIDDPPNSKHDVDLSDSEDDDDVEEDTSPRLHLDENYIASFLDDVMQYAEAKKGELQGSDQGRGSSSSKGVNGVSGPPEISGGIALVEADLPAPGRVSPSPSSRPRHASRQYGRRTTTSSPPLSPRREGLSTSAKGSHDPTHLPSSSTILAPGRESSDTSKKVVDELDALEVELAATEVAILGGPSGTQRKRN